MAIIIGIDPSLTGTGIARVDTDDRLYIDLAISASTGKEAATLTEKRDRLAWLVDDIDAHAMGIHSPDGRVADLALIEAPALSKANTGTSMLNGLFWMLVDRLHVHRIPVVPVGAGQLKKYATGKGNVSKGAVIDSCARRIPYAPTEGNDNLCDATWLAAMGADHLGTPLVDLPKAHREALDKVAWPANVAGVGCAQGVGAPHRLQGPQPRAAGQRPRRQG